MKKKYSHIFFDLDNTLWDFKKNSRFAMEATFRLLKMDRLGIGFDLFFEVYSENNTALWTAYRKKEIKKNELTSQRFQLTFDALKIEGVCASEMNDVYLSEMPKQKFLIEGAIEVLEYLKAKRYKLSIITNGFKDVQHKKLHSSGLAPYFEKVFISEEIMCPKPGHRIFEHAIKSTNARKMRSLMIGDDWDVDVMGALQFGIDAVYFSLGTVDNRINSKPREDTRKGACAIHELRELLTLL